MRRLLPLLLLPTLALAASAPSAVDRALEARRAAAWTASLDATVYEPSPYASPADLPKAIEVERPYQAFNDYYYYALVDGKIWYKPRFKRPAGQRDWVTDLPWKPFGLNGGLPYRLADRDKHGSDTTFADGDRHRFIFDQKFSQATEAEAGQYLTAEEWARASAWEGPAPELDPEFPTVKRIIAITADDEEIAALSEDRQMFYRRKYANIFVNTEWYEGWGQAKELKVFFPFYLTGHRGWSIGRITAAAAGYKEGPDGRIFEWGPAAVSMETLTWLSPDGRKVYYMDSGTPPEVEHFIEAPFRGQWRGEGINSSASTVMVIDRFGAVQTKIADFDLLGSTPTHPYCYFEDCDDEIYYAPGDIRSGMSDIRLPSEGWRVQPPILPPEAWSETTWISKRVTILQTGRGNAERELRVVGMKDGVPGVFLKKIFDDAWTFREAFADDPGARVPAEERLAIEDLRQWSASADLQALHAGEPSLDRRLEGALSVEDRQHLALVVTDYNPEASPWHLELYAAGVALPMNLHLVQAWNPYMPAPPADPAQTVVTFEGTLEFDRAEIERRLAGTSEHPETRSLRKLLDRGKNEKFVLIVNTNSHGITLHTKSKRRTGPVEGAALLEPIKDKAPNVENAEADFWSHLSDQMGWVAAAEALPARPGADLCAPESVEWAADLLFLDARMEEAMASIAEVKKTAAKFSRRIFLTSGALYLFQIKTLDAALDWTREYRSDTVRPNELRYNVITGVTTRIPYLAENISEVEANRLRLVKDEARRARASLGGKLGEAQTIAKDCD